MEFASRMQGKIIGNVCWGFTQNNNENYNQLIQKITPKIVPCDSKVVEIAAYIAAGMFNEGTKSLLYFMSALELSLGTVVHVYVDKEDAEPVMISDVRAYGGTLEGRMARRQQLDLLEATILQRVPLWPWNR
ncbi:uncharacterized protein TNIN_205731 [Trichonephila inaurata madagascariensis]|uniref:Uncharacterized protein n=1 Tax=Trichonephila inaurata madagascariensis TaxID=2747483 RepID=A0A8X7C1U4_9ARAC|nr:uncharacterized protein TNIN_205731 [Trichonephila inaurata madagascariensis]